LVAIDRRAWFTAVDARRTVTAARGRCPGFSRLSITDRFIGRKF
jgi:hypothetical protein